MLRFMVVAALLLSCASRSSGRPCPPPPVPPAEVFAACGGMLYHAPPASATRFSIKFVNKMGPSFQLAEVCILLDGAPLFTGKDIEAAPKDVTWNGRLSLARHRVEVQVVYRAGALNLTVRAVREIAAIDGGSLEIVAHEQGGPTTPLEKRPRLQLALPKDTPEPQCDH